MIGIRKNSRGATNLEGMIADGVTLSTELFINDYVHKLARRIVDEHNNCHNNHSPEDFRYTVNNQYALDASNQRNAVPNTPAYAAAVAAMKEKAIETSTLLINNYWRHMQNQNRAGKVVKSMPFRFLLAAVFNYLISGATPRFTSNAGIIFGAGFATFWFSYYGLSYVGKIVDRKANREMQTFESGIKAEFYRSLRSGVNATS